MSNICPLCQAVKLEDSCTSCWEHARSQPIPQDSEIRKYPGACVVFDVPKACDGHNGDCCQCSAMERQKLVKCLQSLERN